MCSSDLSGQLSPGAFLRVGPDVSDPGSFDAARDQLKFQRQIEQEQGQTLREFLRAEEESDLGSGGMLAWEL